MKRLFSLILAFSFVMLMLAGCASDGQNTPDPENKEPQQTEPTDTTCGEQETTAEPSVEEPIKEPTYINYLTGLESDKDLSTKRPVAIMINNIQTACPQDGITSADIIYECMAEGGITRLMMLKLDYESLGTVGSIRSARDYFVDMSRDYDALFIHAGGSPKAYEEIAACSVERLDYVNMWDAEPYFYRDEWRKENMGYVHSVVTNGKLLEEGINKKKYRTELIGAPKTPFNFVEYGKELVLDGGKAEHIAIPHSIVHTATFEYNAEENVYYHFQFSGEAHIDRTNGEQVKTTNMLILFCDEHLIPGDESHRIDTNIAGTGEGYYFYGGKYSKIQWSRADTRAPLVLKNADGTPFVMNRGTTFVSITASNLKSQITIE